MSRLTPFLLLAWLSCASPTLGEESRANERWNLTSFAGQMTDNVWEEAIVPGKTDLIDSHLIGLALGRDFATRGAFDFGWEGQIVAHFGAQDHWEFNLPVYSRYHFPAHWRGIKSVTFGLGLSYATKIPQTEIDRSGESTRTLFYWMGEIEFHLPVEAMTAVFRLHHRSDGYGVFEADSGSNALVLGLRRNF